MRAGVVEQVEMKSPPEHSNFTSLMMLYSCVIRRVALQATREAWFNEITAYALFSRNHAKMVARTRSSGISHNACDEGHKSRLRPVVTNISTIDLVLRADATPLLGLVVWQSTSIDALSLAS